jgi:CRISPR/Cas system-associated protein Csm6
MELIIIILVVFLAGAGYTIWNLLNKLERLEDFINLQEERDIQLLSTLKDLDTKQMFEKDDEVGSVFDKMKEIIEAYKAGSLKDEDHFYNLKWMQQNVLPV